MNQDTFSVAVGAVRALSMDAVQAANSGHPGTPMALAPLGWLLFAEERKHDPAAPHWPDRDRFVLSCGHASMLQYALLHLSGYEVSLDDLKAFRQWGSLTPGHPEVHHTPGVEVTTGPLGQGLANAVGMAMAERHLAARFNRCDHTLVDHITWCIASDGDLMEGVSAEASSLAGHLKLGKLICFWDDNKITIDGRTDITFTEDVCARYAAYGWHVQSVDSVEDIPALRTAIAAARLDPRPSFIRVSSIIGWPSPGKQNSPKAHGAPLGPDEVKATKRAMGWPEEPAFFVPPEMEAPRAAVIAHGRAAHGKWRLHWRTYAAAHPVLAEEFEQTMHGNLPKGWEQSLPTFPADAKGLATRKSGQMVLQALAKSVPALVGGSADLAESNFTAMEHLPTFGAGEGVPRNIAFGIREHAMGAIVNGMALHGGVVPYGSTFFVFTDYMRPALRLAALCKLQVRYVFTHDSIGLGEDGPTHQPVEHLATLRAMPGMLLLRPCDANEVREAYIAAFSSAGPACLVLSRQNLPTLDRTRYAAADQLHRGAYVLSEATGGAAQAIIISSGSEVMLALKAQDMLAAAGVRVRVVSMPSWELFAKQPEGWREQVLPRALKARVVLEAGSRFGWERWAGDGGRYVTMDSFGASAPAERLFKEFGITAEAAVAAVRDALGLK
ncbi:MAG: transketolase [Planctomycetes bacterium]|nr:transketolase [Planctomycetota bacterium]